MSVTCHISANRSRGLFLNTQPEKISGTVGSEIPRMIEKSTFSPLQVCAQREQVKMDPWMSPAFRNSGACSVLLARSSAGQSTAEGERESSSLDFKGAPFEDRAMRELCDGGDELVEFIRDPSEITLARTSSTPSPLF